jgi:hypothetical protein
MYLLPATFIGTKKYIYNGGQNLMKLLILKDDPLVAHSTVHQLGSPSNLMLAWATAVSFPLEQKVRRWSQIDRL